MVRRTAKTFASIAWPFFKICAYSGPFLGEESLSPKCSQILPRAPRPKNIPLSGNTRVAYRSSRSVKKCDMSGWHRKQIKETRKKKTTLRFDKSRICSDHPQCTTVHHSRHVRVGPGRRPSQSCQVLWKSVKEFRLLEGSKCFFYTWRYGLTYIID